MSFLSFHLNYYKEKIEYYEGRALTQSDIYEAKQLLKVVDDLLDEGYVELFYALQNNFFLADRLKNVIRAAGGEPFPTIAGGKRSVKLKADKAELTQYADGLILRASERTPDAGDDFLTEIARFCNAIEYDESNAYIFLLRDALLPYLFFKTRYPKNVYPYLISRSFLNLFYKGESVDDKIRSVIFNALEKGYVQFEEFIIYCKKHILKKLSPYPQIPSVIKCLLSQIKSRKIVVVETGCNGTFPLLLSALDDRIEFKMYTTLLYLYRTYRDRVFTAAYESLRRFERLSCQNDLFNITDFKDGRFYVSECDDGDIVTKSLGEISRFLQNKPTAPPV